MKKYLKHFLMLFLVLILTGCKAPELPTDDEVKKYISNRFGENNVILAKEDYGTNIEDIVNGVEYTIHSPLNFDYKLVITVNKTEAGGIRGHVTEFKNSFYTNLVKNYRDEFNKVQKKYSSSSINYDFEDLNYTKEEDYYTLSINIKLDLYNVDDANNYLYELKNLFENKFNINNPEDVRLNIVSSSKKDSRIHFNAVYNTDKEIHQKYLEQYFLSESYPNKYNKTYIQELYIDNIKYDGKFLFVYSPYYNKYLISLSDYSNLRLMEDIIKNRYNGSFVERTKIIANTPNDIQYTIGKDKYKIKYPANLRQKFVFKKNNKKLDIEITDTPLYSADYDSQFIKIDDWALLMDCDYEIKNGILYLKIK